MRDRSQNKIGKMTCVSMCAVFILAVSCKSNGRLGGGNSFGFSPLFGKKDNTVSLRPVNADFANVPVDVGTDRGSGEVIKTMDYQIRKGDTLWGISRSHGTSVSVLKQLNGISGDLIREGKTIKVPAVEGVVPKPEPPQEVVEKNEVPVEPDAGNPPVEVEVSDPVQIDEALKKVEEPEEIKEEKRIPRLGAPPAIGGDGFLPIPSEP